MSSKISRVKYFIQKLYLILFLLSIIECIAEILLSLVQVFLINASESSGKSPKKAISEQLAKPDNKRSIATNIAAMTTRVVGAGKCTSFKACCIE